MEEAQRVDAAAAKKAEADAARVDKINAAAAKAHADKKAADKKAADEYDGNVKAWVEKREEEVKAAVKL